MVQAYQQNPDDVELLVKLGEIYLRDDKQFEEAEKLLTKAISMDPSMPDAHIALGKVYEKKN